MSPDKITTRDAQKFNYKFERDVHNFKYLDITINNANNSLEGMKIKETAVDKCKYGLARIFMPKTSIA